MKKIKNNGKKHKRFDYKLIHSFTSRYLKTYYNDIDSDEFEIAQFLVREYRKIKGKPKMLELACGPTIHHALPAVPYVSRIDFADYLPENIEALIHWHKGSTQAHVWNHFTKLILKLENRQSKQKNIIDREKALKKKFGTLSTCDVLKHRLLKQFPKYPIVSFFYCAEEATTDKKEWIALMDRIAHLVLPGGRLFMAALRKTKYYSIVKDGKSVEKLPTAYVSEHDFENFLKRNKFDRAETVLEVVETPDQKHQGIHSIILLSAKKSTQAISRL